MIIKRYLYTINSGGYAPFSGKYNVGINHKRIQLHKESERQIKSKNL